MGTKSTFEILVVDDDPAVRRSLQLSLAHEGYKVSTFESAEEFLERFEPATYGCIIMDVRMPGMKGLELQDRLNRTGSVLPIIFISGHASVPISVRAIKRGAVDFLEKPFRRQALLERIQEAKAELDSRKEQFQARAEIEKRLASLTKREKDVLLLLVCDKPMVSSKSIGTALAISPRTAEQHRASILAKMRVDSVAELGAVMARAGVAPDAARRSTGSH